MKYSTYILLNKEEQTNVRNSYIREAVLNNGLIKLKSIFYGMDSYYFDYKKNTMYKVSKNLCDWNGDETTIFEVCNDQNILEYNGFIIR